LLVLDCTHGYFTPFVDKRRYLFGQVIPPVIIPET
jgi:hypothetical protein